MGGRVKAESTLGQGSVFRVTVPLQSAKQISAAPLGEPHPGEMPQIARLADGCTVRALVADDVRENRDVLAHLLEDIGVSVHTAENGRQALKVIHAESIDIVFMDIRMPEMDGLAATREILSIPQPRRPRLVAVSASALLQERQEYLKAGFEEFLAKPIEAQRLFELLEQLLRVRFEYSELAATPAALEAVNLPDELFSRLRAAAEAYNATELSRCLTEVEQLGDAGRGLAEQLRNWIERSELDQIGRLLAQMEDREL